MTEDLQNLLEKIQREGVEKATTAADKILADARAQADAIIQNAQTEAQGIRGNAEKDARAFEIRAEATIRQVARDIILTIEKAIATLFETLLLQEVNSVMSQPEFVAELVKATIHAYLNNNTELQLVANDKLIELLRTKFRHEAQNGIQLVTDNNIGAGFMIRLANGRIEHPFNGAAIADTLAQQLRPRLAALMKS